MLLKDNYSKAQELEALRRQHQLILNAVGEGVYGLDLQGNVTFANPAAAAMIDWDIQELIGKSMHQVLHHSHPDGSYYPKECCPIYAALNDGSTHRVADETFWRKNGTSFPVEYISTPMRDEQGQVIGAVVTFRDITQRKWAESVLQQTNEDLELKVRSRAAELYTANEHLKELSKLKSRLVSMVCHEFRNPLNNIALSVSSLGRYDKRMSAEQKQQYLLSIVANVERMTQMIDDILVLGKIEAKRLTVSPQAMDLTEFCQVLLKEFQPNCERLQFTGRFKPLMAEIDPTLLRSILINMLSNAIRYSPKDAAVQISLSQRKHRAVFIVKDFGRGISPEDYPHLFEPFHRGKNVSNVPGTGLGLSIVKQFVDLQKGDIKVDSKVGVGTTFKVMLPLFPLLGNHS
ncbi:PAS domain-containing sensor histidine kinase [Leptothoe sp. PORK10 BA2]|uniref:PAS domain-containing sensor histidine kinase n=1 Tax=Leptothoe sp. PORK10 BA2 TaxID=3110254 RepID=UPI002B216BA1|nr:ATP-binding protein [Leptothoe sp. PORK10 BA2]MEA5466788.1 ATP-binding protein [Leptothoe sp. PORK10 BA2]